MSVLKSGYVKRRRFNYSPQNSSDESASNCDVKLSFNDSVDSEMCSKIRAVSRSASICSSTTKRSRKRSSKPRSQLNGSNKSLSTTHHNSTLYPGFSSDWSSPASDEPVPKKLKTTETQSDENNTVFPIPISTTVQSDNSREATPTDSEHHDDSENWSASICSATTKRRRKRSSKPRPRLNCSNKSLSTHHHSTLYSGFYSDWSSPESDGPVPKKLNTTETQSDENNIPPGVHVLLIPLIDKISPTVQSDNSREATPTDSEYHDDNENPATKELPAVVPAQTSPRLEGSKNETEPESQFVLAVDSVYQSTQDICGQSVEDSDITHIEDTQLSQSQSRPLSPVIPLQSALPHFPRGEHVTEEASLTPQGDHVTEEASLTPQGEHVTEEASLTPQGEHVTEEASLIPQGEHVTEEASLTPQGDHVTEEASLTENTDQVEDTAVLVTEETNATLCDPLPVRNENPLDTSVELMFQDRTIFDWNSDLSANTDLSSSGSKRKLKWKKKFLNRMVKEKKRLSSDDNISPPTKGKTPSKQRKYKLSHLKPSKSKQLLRKRVRPTIAPRKTITVKPNVDSDKETVAVKKVLPEQTNVNKGNTESETLLPDNADSNDGLQQLECESDTAKLLVHSNSLNPSTLQSENAEAPTNKHVASSPQRTLSPHSTHSPRHTPSPQRTPSPHSTHSPRHTPSPQRTPSPHSTHSPRHTPSPHSTQSTSSTPDNRLVIDTERETVDMLSDEHSPSPIPEEGQAIDDDTASLTDGMAQCLCLI